MTAAPRSEPIKASVLLLTHNQAAFVEQAVRSVLAQDVAFTMELVVADDASTDGTRERLTQLAERHPETLQLVTHDTHVGVHQNFLDGYAVCSGQYLAMLSGDDYWISPYKLQRQVNFLERHAECAISFHNVLTVHDGGEPEALACSPEQKEFSGVEDLLVENFMPMSSVVYRHGLIREFPEWARATLTWNWALHLCHTQYGRIGYLADTMGVTRRRALGLWNGASARERVDATVAMLEQVNRHFLRKYEAVITASIGRWKQLRLYEQLSESVKTLEGEWMRRLEQLQMQRAATVSDIRAQQRDVVADDGELEARIEDATRHTSELAASRQGALADMTALRSLVEEQGRMLADLRTMIEASSHRGESVTEATLRELSTVGQQLNDVYRWVDVQRTRDLVHAVVPEGAIVLVASKGDPELLRLRGRQGWHFPQTADGIYAGAHPCDSVAATDFLEQMRARGAQYLVFPAASLWWLDHYAAFREYLEANYETLLNRDGVCVIFGLAAHERVPAATVGPPADVQVQ